MLNTAIECTQISFDVHVLTTVSGLIDPYHSVGKTVCWLHTKSRSRSDVIPKNPRIIQQNSSLCLDPSRLFGCGGMLPNNPD